MSEEPTHETGRFYTASRNFKQLLGVFHDGTPIPGGPYTMTQVVVGVVVAIAAWMTRWAWGGHWLFDVPVTLAVAWGALWVTGKLPSSRRSVVNTLNSIWELVSSSRHGTLKGRPFPTQSFGAKHPPAWKKAQDKAGEHVPAGAGQDRVIRTGFSATATSPDHQELRVHLSRGGNTGVRKKRKVGQER